jgi:hypothetical protein
MVNNPGLRYNSCPGHRGRCYGIVISWEFALNFLNEQVDTKEIHSFFAVISSVFNIRTNFTVDFIKANKSS